MRYFDKDDFKLAATSGYMPGVVHNYSSISSAIRDNSLSRIYIGYHFSHGVDIGEDKGCSLSNRVFENALKEKE
jgi:hypothetical protein